MSDANSLYIVYNVKRPPLQGWIPCVQHQLRSCPIFAPVPIFRALTPVTRMCWPIVRVFPTGTEPLDCSCWVLSDSV